MVVVEVVASTPNAEHLIETAYLQCESRWENIEEKRPSKTFDERIEKMFKDGHFSVLDHPSITFSIRRISRATSHQLVRHRIGVGISQMSMRYNRMDMEDMIVPQPIKDSGNEELYLKMAGLCVGTYQALMKEAKVPMDEARYILPNGMMTQLVMTFDARALMHFLRLRLGHHGRPSKEMQEVARQMYEYAKIWMPTVFDERYKQYWE